MNNHAADNISNFRFRFPIRAKLLVAFVGLALIPMLVLAFLVSNQAEKLLENRISHELAIEVETAAGSIETHLAGVRRDVLSLSRFLERRLKSHMTESEWRTVEDEFLRAMAMEQAYYQVRFIATDGMENIRINNENGHLMLVPRQRLQYKGDRYYFSEALKTRHGAIYISPLDFNVELGKIEEPRRLVTRIATAVRDDTGKVRGVVVINVFGEEILGPLAKLKPAPGIRVLLVDEAGCFVEMEESTGTPRFRAGQGEGAGDLAEVLKNIRGGNSDKRLRPTGDNLLAVFPVHAELETAWRLAKIYPRSVLFHDISNLHRTIIILTLLLILVAAWLSLLAAKSFSRPIRELSQFAGKVSTGDYNSRTSIDSYDEFGDLATALNDMTFSLSSSRSELAQWNQSLQNEVDRKVEELRNSEATADAARKVMLRLERQLIQADRLASLGMLSATIAHEIGNPLAGLKMRLQMLQRKTSSDEPLCEDLARMLSLVKRLAQFLTHLTGYVAPVADTKARPVDLVKSLKELEFILCEEADRKRIALSFDLPDVLLPVNTPGQHLHQIFMNLILNALQATGEGGTVMVMAGRNGKLIRTTVRDSGAGLSEGIIAHIFEPLFTTKEKGTGLGLAIVKQLVNELGGTVTIANHPDGGVVAEVLLPEGDLCEEKNSDC